MQLFRIDGTSAVITGAGTGMGRATAVLFAQAGASRLILAGRRPHKLQETATLVAKAAPQCEVQCIAVDIADPLGRRQLIDTVLKSRTSLDFLVNNAGLFAGAALADTTDDLWEQTFALNSTAPLALLRDLMPALRQSKRAAVVNISSTLASKPIPNASAYNSSKASLVQMTRSLALELGPKKIRVNCILPAVVETAMYRDRFTDDAEYKAVIASMTTQHPLGRVGTPEDIAQAVLFLCSDAASWITGVALPVDGGMLCT